MDRDGFQGWSRRSEAAHERIFGAPARCTCKWWGGGYIAEFDLACPSLHKHRGAPGPSSVPPGELSGPRLGSDHERPIMREKIPHCPYDGYPCHCTGACRR